MNSSKPRLNRPARARRMPAAILHRIARLGGRLFTRGTLEPEITTHALDSLITMQDVEAELAGRTRHPDVAEAIERHFQQATSAARAALFVRAASLGVIVYDGFLPLNALMLPDIVGLACVLQLAITTPVTLGLILAVRRRRMSPERAAAINRIGMVGTTLAVVMASRSPHVGAYACLFSLITTASIAGLALPLRWAAGINVSTFLAFTAILCLHPILDPGAIVLATMLNGGTTFYSLLGSHRVEASVRRAYLLALRELLRARDLADDNLQLRDLAELDGLTGLANRRSFDLALDRLWHHGEPGRSVALVMVDIDHFKRFNDRFGHQGGDACLRQVAAAMANTIRGESDTLARFGGEEFAVLVDGASSEQALALAERLRQAIGRVRVPIGDSGGTAEVTASLGCAALYPGPRIAASDLVAAADAALYTAKRQGRNRSEVAEPPTRRAAPQVPSLADAAAPP